MTSNPGKAFLRLLFTITLLALCACTTLPGRVSTHAACEQVFTTSDAHIKAAGMADAGAGRIPRFPYLRTNRLLAALGEQVVTDDGLLEWLERMRQLDLYVRGIESHNLYDDASRARSELEQLDHCGQQLLAADMAAPGRTTIIRQRAKVPDVYRDTARVLGGYPLAVPFLKLGISRWQADTAQAFRQVEEEAPVSDNLSKNHSKNISANLSENLIEYLPPDSPHAAPSDILVASWLAAARKKSTLGIPELTPQQLQRLAQRYAPIWQVETLGSFDRIGAPSRSVSGLKLDFNEPATYVKPSFAQFDGQILLQLEYTVWFSSRPANYWLDPFAGTLDGVVWRVTLDTDGQPLLYDSIHPCGCYHLFFPTQRLRKRSEPGFCQEAVTIAAMPKMNDEVVLRIGSGAHFVRAVSAPRIANKNHNGRKYRLQDYDELRKKRPLRLFDESGIVRGSERLERWFLWPSGVRNAGAMRQSGHRVTAFVGKRYFDDPNLIERYFQRARLVR